MRYCPRCFVLADRVCPKCGGNISKLTWGDEDMTWSETEVICQCEPAEAIFYVEILRQEGIPTEYTLEEPYIERLFALPAVGVARIMVLTRDRDRALQIIEECKASKVNIEDIDYSDNEDEGDDG